MYMNDSDKPKRKPRVSKKPAMAHVTLRIPADVAKWFRDSSAAPTKAMREVLAAYVRGLTGG